jgi:hypothetical protein
MADPATMIDARLRQAPALPDTRVDLMMRAIFAGGGIALIGAFGGALWFLSQGGSSSTGQLTSDEAFMVGFAALLGGIGSLFFARRSTPASSWLTTIVGWILGFHLFPPILTGAAVMLFAMSR